jgi:hypothetical protein
MIADEVVDLVKALLVEGRHSQRRIARMTGVSRYTVWAIANGKRPDCKQQRQAKQKAAGAPFSGPAQRCPTCGAMVQLPCLACVIRERKQKGQLSSPFGGVEGEGLQLELVDRAQRRYEQVRARKRQVEMIR